MIGKVLEIPDNEIFNRIRNQVLAPDVQDWLYSTYQESKSLGMVIINHIEVIWAGVNRLVLDNTAQLPYPWGDYRLSNIEVVEKSIPNSLMEYLTKIGYGDMVQLPPDYKTGVVLAQTYSYTVRNMTMSSFIIADVYITTMDGGEDHLRCVKI